MLLSAESFPSKVTLVYTGESRAISGKRKELLQAWQKMLKDSCLDGRDQGGWCVGVVVRDERLRCSSTPTLTDTGIEGFKTRDGGVVPEPKIIVHIATSADGYVARLDGNLDWLIKRPAPEGFYGLPEFERSVGAKILGRKTFDTSLEMGARFSADNVHYVFSRQPPPADVPPGVYFVSEPIRGFVERLRKQGGKNVWLMGGGEIIGAFLDEDAIDEFIITVVPIFIGEGVPLIAPRHLEVPLLLQDVQRFPDGMVQLHYQVQRSIGREQ